MSLKRNILASYASQIYATLIGTAMAPLVLCLVAYQYPAPSVRPSPCVVLDNSDCKTNLKRKNK